MNILDVQINSAGKPKTVKGPKGTKFNLTNVRNVPHDVQLCLENLEPFSGTIVFPNNGNSPILPACFAAFNKDSKIVIHESDSHDYKAIQDSLKGSEEFRFQLGSDLELINTEGSFLAVFRIPLGFDRLLCFDVMERLNHVLPDKSQVLITMAKKRYKDLIKKLNKEFSGGQVLGRNRDAVLFKGLTSKSKDKWTSRINAIEVNAIDADLSMYTRPGVFSHGRVDAGGLALYETLELNSDESFLELGCGAGLVGLLAAIRCAKLQESYKGEMVLVDSSCRAIECAKKNVESLGFNVECVLEDDYETDQSFDVFAGNPPYYANHRIASYFIETAAKVLGEGGRLYLVSKHGQLMEEMAKEKGFTVDTVKRRGYDVLIGRKLY